MVSSSYRGDGPTVRRANLDRTPPDGGRAWERVLCLLCCLYMHVYYVIKRNIVLVGELLILSKVMHSVGKIFKHRYGK